MSAKIFISYAHEDERAVSKLYHELANAGFQPWMDKMDLMPGEMWQLAIENALLQADFLIICLSNNLLNKHGFVQREFRIAFDLWQKNSAEDIYIVPVMLEPVDHLQMPMEIRRFQWVNLYEEDGRARLFKAIQHGMQRRGKVLRTILEESALPFDPDLAPLLPDSDMAEPAIDRLLPKEWQAAIERLVTIPKRRAAAQAAQIELDARLLERCADTAEISQVHHTLAAVELAGPASSLLRSFSRLSKDVDAALRQESAYNQRLALNIVEDKLDSLLRELIRSSERYASRFLSIAQSWRQIVARQVRELAEAAEQRQEIDSPYIIGVPLTAQQEIFVGRNDIHGQIEQLLLDRRRPPLLLYGQRRMGKTSLLNNLGRLLPSSIIPLFVDLQGPASAASDHAGLLYNLARGMTASAERQRDLALPSLSRESLADDPFTRFDEWLDEVERALGGNSALLALDEFEALDGALREGRFSETSVLGMLRHLIQHRPRFKVLLAGSHTLDELHRWASYLINVQMVKLSYLKEDEARQLIEHPVKDFTLRYEADASQRALDLTRGHPYLVQLLCAEIVAMKNTQAPSIRRRACLSDVEQAVPEALSHGSQFFADIEHNQIDAVSLDLLRFLAAKGEGGVANQSELAREFAVEPEPALDLLLRRDLIEPTNGDYRFQVEMIRRWFAQTGRVNRAFRSVKSWLRRAVP